ncbi:WD repeat domain-containing protein 83 [Pleurostoma richardsiae]|uniref:WD repeat domain-containing protein 83 n=1 Tax=Pleurostoma richardsiae TaxID=41990 RepID=A0AA38S2W0_9PEZI|nr:WD repeat domain-containing protein 83 [Pleurostoma richardsiae]
MLLSAGFSRITQTLLAVSSGYQNLCNQALLSSSPSPPSSASASSFISPPPDTMPSSLSSRLARLLCAGAAVQVACAQLSSALNITIYQPNATLAPSPLPPPGSSSAGAEIIRQLTQVTRSTAWTLVDSVPFEGDTFEPEGILRLGPDRYVVSAGEYTVPTKKYFSNGTYVNGTDRTAGAGFAHLIVFDGGGRRVADATLTRAGAEEYHNGGLDYDGEHIWAAVAQYRPNTTAQLVRVDPATLEPETVLRAADHLGGVVHDVASGRLVALNWGSRAASTFDLRYRYAPAPEFSAPQAVVNNPSSWSDYQDCKYLGASAAYDWRSVMLCSGIASLYNTSIGGLAIVDVRTMVPLWEVPLTMVSGAGNLVTKNPMDVAVVDGRVRLYFLPDERNSTLYVYEPEL